MNTYTSKIKVTAIEPETWDTISRHWNYFIHLIKIVRRNKINV